MAGPSARPAAARPVTSGWALCCYVWWGTAMRAAGRVQQAGGGWPQRLRGACGCVCTLLQRAASCREGSGAGQQPSRSALPRRDQSPLRCRRAAIAQTVPNKHHGSASRAGQGKAKAPSPYRGVLHALPMMAIPLHPQVHPKDKRLVLGWNQTLAVGVLPCSRFLGGHTGFIQKLYEIQQVKPLMVHATFQCEFPRAPHAAPLRRLAVGASCPAWLCTGGASGWRQLSSEAGRGWGQARRDCSEAEASACRACVGCADGGNMGKRHRMREAALFADPPSYWTGARPPARHARRHAGHARTSRAQVVATRRSLRQRWLAWLPRRALHECSWDTCARPRTCRRRVRGH